MSLNSAPVSKRIRFEIFKRDVFTCQYCGSRPPDVVLEVDHIEPRAAGGGNENINLITSCFDCNRGKGKKPLGVVAVRPDANLELLEAQQELAEARRFLLLKSELDTIRDEEVAAIQSHWYRLMPTNPASVPADHVLLGWLTQYSAEEVTVAIEAFARYYKRDQSRFSTFDDKVKYIGGILWHKREGL